MTRVINLKTLLILALIVLLAYLAIIPEVADLPKLPQTDHAQSAHQNQKWNTAAIVTAMSGGNCGTVSIYACSDDTLIYTCQSPTDPKKLLGLVVGQTNNQIITGYASRASHWNSKIK